MRKWIALISLSLPLAAWTAASSPPDPLHLEAEKVFAFDRTHPHALPADRIRALSIALEFYDLEGARHILKMLRPLY
jgi:hypothetical protein